MCIRASTNSSDVGYRVTGRSYFAEDRNHYSYRYLRGLPKIFESFVDIPRQLRYIIEQRCQEIKRHTNSSRFGYKVTGRSYFADHRHHYPCRYLTGFLQLFYDSADVYRQVGYVRDQICQDSMLHTNSRRFGYSVTVRIYFAYHRDHYPCRYLTCFL